jgi:hypothetical protein
METKLEYLKSKNDDSHMNDIITLEQNIKDVIDIKFICTIFTFDFIPKFFLTLDFSNLKKYFEDFSPPSYHL